MIAPLVKKLNLELKGVSPLERMAGNIVLGLELHHKKKALGYVGGGGWWAWRDEAKAGTRMTWETYCQTEAGITEASARYYFEAFEAVKLRMKYASKSEKTDLYWCMCIPPSELTKDQRKSLVERIVRLGLTEGDTMKYLRKEYRAARGTDSKIPPSEETAAEPSLPAEAASEMDQSIAILKRAGGPEIEKLLRLRGVIAEECERRTKKKLEQLLQTSRREKNMDALANLALEALKNSYRIG